MLVRARLNESIAAPSSPSHAPTPSTEPAGVIASGGGTRTPEVSGELALSSGSIIRASGLPAGGDVLLVSRKQLAGERDHPLDAGVGDPVVDGATLAPRLDEATPA